SRPNGTTRPSVLAVFRLITKSNFVGCKTGRSAGFSPLRIRATHLSIRIGDTRSVADQPALDGIFPKLINGGQPILRGERDDTTAASIKIRVGRPATLRPPLPTTSQSPYPIRYRYWP